MKISITFLFSFFCCVTISFCQNNQLTTYKVYFDKDLRKWTQSFKNFQLSKFKLSDTIKFENVPFGDTEKIKDFYDLYKPALTFSDDSSQFLDIYSYWLNLEKKGNKVVDNPEVDQAISLCNLKTNKWIQIYFCGYSTRIDEVVWLTKARFILAGSEMDENNNFHPKVLIGDIVKQSFLVYNDKLSTSTKAGYTSLKLKKLNIQDE